MQHDSPVMLGDSGGEEIDDTRGPVLAAPGEHRLDGARAIADVGMQRKVDEADGAPLSGSRVTGRITRGVAQLQIDGHAGGE